MQLTNARVIAALFTLSLGAAFAAAPQSSVVHVAPTLGYTVVARYPHLTSSYTEGFLYLDGLFYEGVGLGGHSAVLAVQPETGKIVRRADLAPEYFGGGMLGRGRATC